MSDGNSSKCRDFVKSGPRSGRFIGEGPVSDRQYMVKLVTAGHARAPHVSPRSAEAPGLVRWGRVWRDDGGFHSEDESPGSPCLFDHPGESVGSLILIVGFLTRFAALSLATIMVGAIALVHWPNGFFMNWFGQQAGEGFEYHLMVIAIAASLVLSGGGRWSVDRKIAETLN